MGTRNAKMKTAFTKQLFCLGQQKQIKPNRIAYDFDDVTNRRMVKILVYS